MRQVLATVFVVLGFAGHAQAQGALDVEKIYLGTYGGTICPISSGSGAPSGSTTCATYIDYASGEIYSKRSSGSWTLLVRAEDTNTFTVDQTFNTNVSVLGALKMGPSATAILQSSTADLIEMYRTTNAQRFNIFNTRTSSTNNEYGYLWWNSNIFRLGTDNGSGGGTDRNIALEPGNTTALTLAAGTLAATFAGAVSAPSLTLTTTPLPCTSGGTGNSGYTVGGILFAAGSCSVGNIIPVAVGQVLASNGVGSGPLWTGNPTVASIASTSYLARSAGWIFDNGGNGEINATLYTPALHTKSFVAENEAVIDGAFLITPGRAIVYEAFTVPALGAASGNFRLEYKPGSTANVFTSGDTVVLRTFVRNSGALIVGDAIGVVTSPSSTNPNYQEWTFTRNSGASGGTLPTSTVIAAKTVAVDYGVTGNGFIEFQAIAPTLVVSMTSSGTTATATTSSAHGYKNSDTAVITGATQTNYNGSFSITVTGATTFTYTMPGTAASPATCASPCMVAGAYGLNTPYTRIGTWVTAPTAANTTPRWLNGNLRALTGTLEYGFLAGDFAGNHYVRMSDQNAEIVGIPLSLKDGSTTTIKLDSAVPSIALGSTLPSAYGTGTGVWMGKDSGAYKFRVGNPSGDRLTFDTSLTVVSTNVTIDSTGITLGGLGSGFSSGSAYRFTRPTGLGYGQAGDIFSTWAESSAGLDRLFVQNKIVGTGSTYGNAHVVLSSLGWDRIGLVNFGEANITLESNQTRVRALTSAAIVEMTATTDVRVTSAIFKVTNAAADLQVTNGTTNMSLQPGFFGTTSNHAWVVLTNNGTNATFCAAGGLTVGSPTGGCKGAGTINVTAAYDDNVLLTDWVFELAYDQRPANGDTPWPPTARRLYSLADVRAVTVAEHRLPWMPKASEFDVQRHTGGMITRLYQGQEQQQLYLFDLEARLAALEQLVRRQ